MKNLILILSTFFFCQTITTAQFGEKKTYDAEGMGEEIRELPAFNAIVVKMGIHLNIHQADEQKVEVKGQDFPVSKIKTEVRKGILHISPEMKIGNNNINAPTVDVWVNDLYSIKAKMGATVTTNGQFKTKELEVSGKMGSTLVLNIDVETLNIKSGMGANFILSGEADDLVVESRMGSGFNAENLMAKRGEISMKGGSTARVNVSEELMTKASFGGSIGVEGNPKMLKQKKSMGGEIYTRKKRETL